MEIIRRTLGGFLTVVTIAAAVVAGGGIARAEAPLAITTQSIPQGEMGVAYSTQISATGGSGGYTWNISSGNPPLSINSSSGVLSSSGPLSGGNDSMFTVTVMDSVGDTATSPTYTLLVDSPVSISTSFLPTSPVGESWASTLTATGGTASYTWSATGLPSWLSLGSATGILSGTPPSGTSTSEPVGFNVTVTDTAGGTNTVSLNLYVTVPVAYLVENESSGGLVFVSGDGTSVSQLSSVSGYDVAYDAGGNAVVATVSNLERITPKGTTSIIATAPSGAAWLAVASDGSGNYIVGDNEKHGVWRVSPDGVSSVFVGTYPVPNQDELEDLKVLVDVHGNYIVAEDNGGVVGLFSIAPGGAATTITLSGETLPTSVYGFAFDSNNNYALLDSSSHILFRISPQGAVSEISTGLSGGSGLARNPLTNQFVAGTSGALDVIGGNGYTALASNEQLSSPEGVAVLADDFPSAVDATNPLGYFRLETSSGFSEVANSYTYSLNNGASIASTGAPIGNAENNYASLNGEGGYVATSLAGNIITAGSMMAWVNLAVLPSTTDEAFNYVAGESTQGNDFDLQFNSSNVLGFYTTDSGQNLSYTPNPNTLVGQWHMIVVTFDATTGTRAIYWDGALVASDNCPSCSSFTNKTGTFNIGSSTVFPSRYFNGGIDEVAIWNYALTAPQVYRLFATRPPGVSGTVNSLSPTSIPMNSSATTLTISGNNFSSDCDGNPCSYVWFTAPGGQTTIFNQSSQVTSVTSNQIAVTIPSALLMTAGVAQVSVTNQAGVPSNRLPLTIQATLPPPTISPVSGTLTSGQINQAYSTTLTASGGSGNFSWSIVSQSAGLNLSVSPATGTSVSLTGTPMQANISPGLKITVMVTDTTTKLTQQQIYTIPVSAAPGSVTIGISAAESDNCYPYSCGYSDGLVEWQQHFAASAFGVSGPISIRDFVVTAGPDQTGLSSDTGTFKVYLSTAVNTLGNDSSNLASNIGPDKVLFATVSFGPTMPATFTVTGTAPFVYNPANGDLLIDVQFPGYTSKNGDYVSFFNADTNGTTTLRNYNSGDGVTANDTSALITEFDFGAGGVTPPPPQPLSLTGPGSLGEIAVGSSVSASYIASGGQPAYTFISTGLPSGLTLNAQTGALTGSATQPGAYSFSILVSDSETPSNGASLQVTLNVLGITTASSLPGATAGKAYSQTFAAAGGTGTYTFSSSNAPAGLALTGAVLSGTPAAPGTFTFQVQVTDGSGITASSSFTITIAAGPFSITSSGNLGEIALGANVAGTLTATGGKQPYTWSATGLPAGVTLNASSGAFGGSPSQPGNYSFTAQVADAETPPATQSVTVTLQVLGFTIPAALPTASTTTAYSQTFTAAGGTGSYTFSSSSAPAGLSFKGAVLSGTPTTVGTYSFPVNVSDASGFTASSTFSLEVTGSSGPLSVTGGALTAGEVGSSYSQTLTATDGQPPYTWAITGGALPAGLSLNGASGLISGTPSIAELSTFTAQATDSSNASASGVFTITIAPKPLSVTGLPFPNGIVGSSYPLQILSAAGGVGPYTFTVGSGTLPPGLTLTSGQLSGTPTASGTYSFSITTTDSETPGQTLASPVQVVVSPAGAANLILSAASLSFNLSTGSAGLPVPYDITVESSAVVQSLNYSVVPTPTVPWLDVTGGGATPGSIGIALDPSALNLGATVTPLTTSVAVTCLAPSPCAGMAQTIGVSLSVTAPAPELSFTTSLVQFSATLPATAPIGQQVGIQNIGGGAAVITSATAADSWLTVSGVPPSVSAGPPVNLTLTASPGGLGAGFYRTTVTIISSGGTITVPVTLDIAPVPTLTLSTSGVQLQSTLGSAPAITSGSFQVGSSAGTVPNFTAAVQPGAPWLLLTGSSTATGTVNYSIDPVASAALTPAQAYYGTIEITSSGVTNSPQDFEVVLNVASPTTLAAPNPQPAGLVFQTLFGASAPPSQTVTVYSSSAASVTYSASASTNSGGSWLAVSPETGTTSASSPAASTVTVTPGTLMPGVYTGTVSYQFSAAAVRSVNVTLIVEAAGGASSGTSGISVSSATQQTTGCTPSRLVPTQTALTSNFAQPTSWPTPLSIVVVNDCGTAVPGSQVVTTFSNGDPPLALRLVNGGTGLYSGTWTPRTTSGQVTVTATATAPGFSAAVATINGEVIANSAPLLAAGGTLHIYNPLVGAPIGQGTILQIYGSGLGASPAVATTVPLTTTMNGTSVIIGGIPAALYYVSATQIDAQLPIELTPGNTYNVIVNANGQLSTPSTIQVSAATPGIAAFASGQIVAQHGDYSLVSETSPGKPGEYLVIYLSGLGLTNVSVADGAASPDPSNLQLLNPLIAPTLTLNGQSIPIYFSGLTPGYVGLYQMNFQVPPGTPNGDMQLVVSQSGQASNSTILPVHN